MPSQPNFTQLFALARNEALLRNARLSRDAIERAGMDANVMIAAACAAGDEVSGSITDLQTALYLFSATGTDLDNLVFDRYGIIRKPDAASIGSVNFTTSTPAGSTFTIPSGTVLSSSTGTQYITTQDAIYSAGSTGPVIVMIRSALAGSGQNANANTITSIVSQITGAPNNLAVTNPLASVGSDAAETDDALRNRAQQFFVTARRGTTSAIQNAALSVPGIRTATAFEVLDALGRPARLVQLVVADAFTEQFANTSVTPPTFPALSQAITVSVQDALAEYRADGIFVQIVVANVVLQPVQLVLAFFAGVDANAVALEARATVVGYINALAPGAPFVPGDANTPGTLYFQLANVPGLAFTGKEVVSPIGNVIPKSLQVIRTTLSLVAAVSAQTNVPLATGVNPDSYIRATN